MNGLERARQVISIGADVMADAESFDEEFAAFLVRCPEEAQETFAALTVLTNRALEMLTDEQRAAYWRSIDTTIEAMR